MEIEYKRLILDQYYQKIGEGTGGWGGLMKTDVNGKCLKVNINN